MWRMAACLALICGSVSAQDRVDLDGSGIRAALDGQKLVYGSGAWQEFRVLGGTLYNAGQDSWGDWRVEGDLYCSLWPPSDLWACFGMQRAGDRLRFLDSNGEITEGHVE